MFLPLRRMKRRKPSEPTGPIIQIMGASQVAGRFHRRLAMWKYGVIAGILSNKRYRACCLDEAVPSFLGSYAACRP